MGLWDAIHSAAAKIHEVGRASAAKIDEGVRTHGDEAKQKVKEYLPGPEGREKFIQALTHPATREVLKFVAPGGVQAAYIVGSVLQLGKNQNQNDIDEQIKYEHVIQRLKLLQAENERMQQQINKLYFWITCLFIVISPSIFETFFHQVRDKLWDS